MKIKSGLLMLLALVISLGLSGSVFALEARSSVDGSVNVSRDSSYDRDGVSSTSTIRATTSSDVRVRSVDDNSTSSRESDRNSTSSEERDSDDRDVRANGTTTIRSDFSIDNESRTAIFVRNLLNIANRNSNIGVEIRAIAREQGDSSTSTAESINRIEARNSFKTFLIGSDYRNLGALRSELTRTDNRIERLRVLASSTVSAQVKVELDAEIKSLVDDRAKVMAFVNARENSFSLFGWFVKMFNK